MRFKLIEKLISLEGYELYLLIGAAAAFVALLIYALIRRRIARSAAPQADGAPRSRVQALVYGALCLTLSFVLSYCKLFSMPFGGSITLCSMLPLMLYAAAFGPAYGFTAALAYALMQIIQGAYIIHPVQFVLDYLVAFTCLGLSSLFPHTLVLGALVAGFSRMLASIVSGAVFFRDAGLDYGVTSPWLYALFYNGLTIGVDTVLCAVVAALPPVSKLYQRLRLTR